MLTKLLKLTQLHNLEKPDRINLETNRRRSWVLQPNMRQSSRSSAKVGKKGLEEPGWGVGDQEHQENMPHRVNGPGLLGAHRNQGAYRGSDISLLHVCSGWVALCSYGIQVGFLWDLGVQCEADLFADRFAFYWDLFPPTGLLHSVLIW